MPKHVYLTDSLPRKAFETLQGYIYIIHLPIVYGNICV